MNKFLTESYANNLECFLDTIEYNTEKRRPYGGIVNYTIPGDELFKTSKLSDEEFLNNIEPMVEKYLLSIFLYKRILLVLVHGPVSMNALVYIAKNIYCSIILIIDISSDTLIGREVLIASNMREVMKKCTACTTYLNTYDTFEADLNRDMRSEIVFKVIEELSSMLTSIRNEEPEALQLLFKSLTKQLLFESAILFYKMKHGHEEKLDAHFIMLAKHVDELAKQLNIDMKQISPLILDDDIESIHNYLICFKAKLPVVALHDQNVIQFP